MSDYLYGTNFILEQKEEMYHFNSDTILLGAFLDTKKSDNVLEIGCAQGALLLYASIGKPKKLTGIDLFEEVINQAKHNLELNHVEADCFTSSAQDFAKLHNSEYTFILCNPPYFKTTSHSLRKQNPYLSAARHDEYLPLEDLFSSVRKMLKDNGRFEMVHRASALNMILETAHTYGFSLWRMRPIYDHINGNAKSILLEFRIASKDSETKIEVPAYLDQKETFFLEASK